MCHMQQLGDLAERCRMRYNMITQKKKMTSETLHDTKIPKRDANCETDVKSKVIKEASGQETVSMIM